MLSASDLSRLSEERISFDFNGVALPEIASPPPSGATGAEPVKPPTWVDDRNARACAGCDSAFNLFNRKHVSAHMVTFTAELTCICYFCVIAALPMLR